MVKERLGERYGLISRINHWLIAFVFIGMICFGFYLEFGIMERETRGALMGIHKSIGAIFLILALWRVGWRFFQGFPKDIAVMPKWQSVAARAVHWLLLLSVLLMPLSGVLMSLFGARSINVFGLLTIPAFEKSEVIAGTAHSIHGVAPYIISGIIFLHIFAALKHHFIDKDETMKRMLRSH